MEKEELPNFELNLFALDFSILSFAFVWTKCHCMSNQKHSLETDEVDFQIQEIFVSRTDRKGIIRSGNDVFVRVSGFEEAELVSSPHNIIRHSDMPKCIFKLFWETLKKGESICAYVKNKSKDGKYYWVLATAFPIENGYLSIRIKPSTDLFTKVKVLYADVLRFEKERGMDAAYSFLFEQLKSLGFSSYQEFMLKALSSETESRDNSLQTVALHSLGNGRGSVEKVLSEMRQIAESLVLEFRKTARSASSSAALKNLFREKADLVSNICDRLEHLTLNMSIAAHKLGKEGATLSVVASNFQERSRSLVQNYRDFKDQCGEFVIGVEKILLEILTAKLQIEMLSAFILEIVQEPMKGSGYVNSGRDKLRELEIILGSLLELFQSSQKSQRSFYNLVRKLDRTVLVLHQYSLQMELIVTGGKLEGSRSGQTEERFTPFLSTMVQEITALRNPIAELMVALKSAEFTFSDVVSRVGSTEHSIREMLLLLRQSGQSVDEVPRGA